MGRWLAYIRLFSFDIVHVPGMKHKGPDALSRRPATAEEAEEMKKNGKREEEDIEAEIEAALGRITYEEETDWQVGKVLTMHGGEEELEKIAEWLLTLRRPAGMSNGEFRKFKREETKYLVRDGILYWRGDNKAPPRKVISAHGERQNILAKLHDESGHRGRDATYIKVKNRFHWKGMYSDVDKFVQSCEQCQKRRPHRYDEPLHPTFSYSLWMKLGLDVVHMPTATDGCKYLVGLHDDLSGWAEYKAIRKANSKTIAKFIYETQICRYGCPAVIVCGGSPKNQGITGQLLKRYGIKNIQIVPYHPQSNGLVERGHQNIVDALAKMTAQSGNVGSWIQHLPAAMWADRITVR